MHIESWAKEINNREVPSNMHQEGDVRLIVYCPRDNQQDKEENGMVLILKELSVWRGEWHQDK